jgi:ubiquinone/menaquinone biosynthesis C-methylase UbiE
MRLDYMEITELPGNNLSAEQMARFAHRYAVCAALARGRILEVACGPAIGLGALQAAGNTVTGLCYTPSVIYQAQVHYQDRFPLMAGDAQQLPVKAAGFDTVLCLEAIYYFQKPAAFLAEARRVLAPGGLLLVAGANPDWPHFVPGNLSRHYPTAPELATWLQATGFDAVQLFGAFALNAAGARHATAVRLRQLLLQSKLRQAIGPVEEQLRRLAYGQLEALPRELPVDVLHQAVATLDLNPLSVDQPDRMHRVLYALGHAPVLP